MLNLFLDIYIADVPLYQWIILTTVILMITSTMHVIKNRIKQHSDKELHGNAKDYLKKAEEYDREPLPLLMVLVLVTLVFVEAAGFAYIFSEYILPDASGSEYRMASIFGAVVISMILVPLTHITGEHIYYNKKASKAKSYMELDGENYSFSKVDNDIEIENTKKDDNKAKSIKLISRINFEWKDQEITKKYLAQAFTWILVIIIATTAYIVREQTYEQIAIEERIQAKVESKENVAQNNDINDYLKQSLAESEDIYHTGKIIAKERSNDTTYFLLSFLFLAIQVLGIYSGLKWGFVGKFSKEAYADMKSYKKKGKRI